ncbi:hypothetical protein CQW23_31402 [Capsicum baccatum]|uniref:Receptor-like protein 12 n=1 Tax=Capsicum baccatum TaxID=33114 RepID=A0A2G2V7I6_CAPBA|nr:hypothetical protein CQW23_31402 [Capsicum baccatum]
MMMSHNKLSGQLPPSICNLTLLKVPDLGRNNLMGAIPQCFGNISSHLEVLDMQYNNLSSTLPTTFSIGSALGSFNLHGNELEGKIPRSLENCKLLEVVDFGDNLLNDTFPMLLNKLHGHIPSIIGDLIALRILNLSHNGLQGHIPRSLGSLSSVESLDLSGNHLVGEIPAQFASLTSLEVLNLSNNHLEGCIPQGNQFHTFENNSYEGNDGLRGFPLSKGCGNYGDDSISEVTYAGPTLDEKSNSEFLNDFWKAALMGYGTGLCIGLSIIYFLISTGNMKWLERIVEELEHKIMMARRKKQRRQTYSLSYPSNTPAPATARRMLAPEIWDPRIWENASSELLYLTASLDCVNWPWHHLQYGYVHNPMSRQRTTRKRQLHHWMQGFQQITSSSHASRSFLKLKSFLKQSLNAKFKACGKINVRLS